MLYRPCVVLESSCSMPSTAFTRARMLSNTVPAAALSGSESAPGRTQSSNDLNCRGSGRASRPSSTRASLQARACSCTRLLILSSSATSASLTVRKCCSLAPTLCFFTLVVCGEVGGDTVQHGTVLIRRMICNFCANDVGSGCRG